MTQLSSLSPRKDLTPRFTTTQSSNFLSDRKSSPTASWLLLSAVGTLSWECHYYADSKRFSTWLQIPSNSALLPLSHTDLVELLLLSLHPAHPPSCPITSSKSFPTFSP